MLPGTIDDRSAVVPSNLQDKDTQASVSTTVTAQEGDAFVFDYNLGVFFNDYLSIVKDGETVKFISGWHDWDTWAIPLEEGEHTIDICFRKNVDPADFPPEMAATAAISDVRLLSGEDAAKALAAVPVYPVDAETSIEVLTEGARKVKGLSGGMDILTMALGCDVYDMGGNEIRIRIHADSSHDPDATLFEDTIGGVDYMLAELLNEDGTAFEYTVSFPDPEDENAIGLMLLAGQNYRESGYLQEYICGSQAAAENIVSTVGGQVGRELEPAFEDMQSESAE